MSRSPDYLYELLPAIYRQRDEEQNQPLGALLRVIGEQVNLVEANIDELYENLFVETSQEWAVPYIGDLIGYRPVHEAGTPGDVVTLQAQQRNKILIPRREVANTIRYRRRKGTLALLELLANDVSGWPARAAEFYRLLFFAQALNHLQPTRGQTVDLRRQAALDRLHGPFDKVAHIVDIRPINSDHTRGHYNIPTVGLFVWRLRAYPITDAPAYCQEEAGTHCYTFSALANDTPLYTSPAPEVEPDHLAGELNLPIPIRRYAFQEHTADYYGATKSIEIWVEDWVEGFETRRPIPVERIVPADLTGWHYRPHPGRVAVDPELGRIAFPPRQVPDGDVWVTFHYGFSGSVGGGEYERLLQQQTEDLLGADDLREPSNFVARLQDNSPFASYLRRRFSPSTRSLLAAPDGDLDALVRVLIEDLNRLLQGEAFYDPEDPDRFGELPEELLTLVRQDPQGRARLHLNRLLLQQAFPEEIAKSFSLYRVSQRQGVRPIHRALRRWKNEKPRHAVIEITDSGAYTEQINISLERNQTLQIRAANRKRPVIRLLDWKTARPDALRVKGKPDSRFSLDGVLIFGRGLLVKGELAGVTIRHSTLVPGWTLEQDCEPVHPAEPSLQLVNTPHACINVEHSIIGSIQLNQDEVRTDPIPILISDSVLDATGPDLEALGAPGGRKAQARLTVARSTVFGKVQVHAIELAENSIFDGRIEVARRQLGCMRFCYVEVPDSRTPRRYNCQPDLVERAVREDPRMEPAPDAEKRAAVQRERKRVRPRFNSVRYGTPTYSQLAEHCAEEIKRGADDESEMGVFHNLFQPQRVANLRARLDEYTPAGMEAGIVFVS